jgi:NTE family protein
MRALHDRGILDRVFVLSGVSGGSVIAALYAYSADPFEVFERRVESVLSKGMIWGIARETLVSSETLKIALTVLTSGIAALVGRFVQIIALPLGWLKIGGSALPRAMQFLSAPLPRFASLTTAFERHLQRAYFGDRHMSDVGRHGLRVVLNAAELRTESAFRFGSVESGCWRYGRLVETPRVSTAVAASAAFPAFLPALDKVLEFEDKNSKSAQRVIITDGGAYDNLGISCMLPGRTSEFSTNVFPVDFIIACDASQGIPTGARMPYYWGSRMLATIYTIHRRIQSMSQNLLHRMAAAGEIKGFVLPYLGQIDSRLPVRPTDLVTREDTVDYPTNFNPMSSSNIRKLSKRGEQLTNTLLDSYAPYL